MTTTNKQPSEEEVRRYFNEIFRLADDKELVYPHEEQRDVIPDAIQSTVA